MMQFFSQEIYVRSDNEMFMMNVSLVLIWPGPRFSSPGPVLVREFLNEILIWHWTRSQLLELYTPGTVSKTND